MGAWPRAGREGAVRPLALWAAFFAYSAAAALLVQLVLLPYVLPAWHAGDGLLAGGDWLVFHQVAAGLAGRIREHGWSMFEIHPGGYGPAGIAAGVYALTVPKPWALIPLNAAVHATAAALLVRLVGLLTSGGPAAVASALPFLLYPSSLTWVSQIHKDGYFSAGFLSLLYGWVRLARDEPAAGPWTRVQSLALVAGGYALVWIARPPMVGLLQATAVLVALIVTACWLHRAARGAARLSRALAVSALVTLTVVAPTWVPDATLRLRRPAAFGEVAGAVTGFDGVDPWGLARGVRALPWYRAAWLPAAVDTRAYQVALIREQFQVFYREGWSNLDPHVGFYRATDLLRYLPRATQIALWAPFPTHWLAAGSLPATTLMRRVAGLEMLGVYLAMLPLPLALWRWRRRVELWVVLVPCLSLLELYALTIPNLGALYRFRYPFLMVLVALGVAGAWAQPTHQAPSREGRARGCWRTRGCRSSRR